MKKLLPLLFFTSLFSGLTHAADYVIDTKGAHASINFKIKHLGYSWLAGRFNKFDGTFSYDAKKPNESKVTVNINTASFDSNHAERDKHIRSDDFLDVEKYPSAQFTSTSIKELGNNKLEVKGKLTLHGVTKNIVIDAEKIGEGKDPWGGYRAGFAGSTKIKLSDFNIKQPGSSSTYAHIELHIEGKKQ